MDRVDHKVRLSYKDVLLVPYDDDFVSVLSRNDPDISTEVCPGKKIKVPLISAPMDTITGADMAIAMNMAGGLGVLTRYIDEENEIQKQAEEVKEVYKNRESPSNHVAVAIGVRSDIEYKCKMLCDAGANIICLDIANGNHVFMRNALSIISDLKKYYAEVSVIAGNVATGKAAKRLADHGADAIKIGIGPGGVCSTRRVTGFGVPQLTAIMDCADALSGYNVKIIGDGGIRNSSDVSKCLWAGADCAMVGFILSGCDECPQIDNHFGDKKIYRGMSSRNVSRRSDIAEEGVCVEVENKGPLADIVKEYAAAIRATCSMANAMNLTELRKNVRAIRVSTMSNEESEPINF